MAALHNISTVVRGVVCNSPSQSALGHFWGTFHPQKSTLSQLALRMGVKVPKIKYDFWCERDIRGTHGTKREKYGGKYSGENAALVTNFLEDKTDPRYLGLNWRRAMVIDGAFKA